MNFLTLRLKGENQLSAITEDEYEILLANLKRGRKVNTKAGETVAPISPKPSKYHSKKTWIDGICFDSKREADYYEMLKFRLAAKEISGFTYHGFMVCTAGIGSRNRATLYETDFVILYPDKTYEIIDVKGMSTQVFKLKMKSLLEKYPDVKILLK